MATHICFCIILAAFVAHQKHYVVGKNLPHQKLCIICKVHIYIKVESSEVMIWVWEVILQAVGHSLMQHLE